MIRLARSPMVAARMGRSRQRPLRLDWEQAKDALMLEGLRAKFTQHADIRAVLLATGDAPICEHTRKDSYWGDGGDGSGRNMLGTLLMRVRDELRGQRGVSITIGLRGLLGTRETAIDVRAHAREC